MEEKKGIKVKLITILLVIAVIVIVVMGFVIYKLSSDKASAIQKSTDLQSQVDSLSKDLGTLQGKIDDITNIINDEEKDSSDDAKDKSNDKSDDKGSDDKESDDDDSGDKDSGDESGKKEYTSDDIQGTYEQTNPDADSEGCSYVFSGNTVTCETLGSQKGTFKVEGNKVKITYIKFYDPEGNAMDSTRENNKEELTISNENVLTKANPANGFVSIFKKK